MKNLRVGHLILRKGGHGAAGGIWCQPSCSHSGRMTANTISPCLKYWNFVDTYKRPR